MLIEYNLSGIWSILWSRNLLYIAYPPKIGKPICSEVLPFWAAQDAGPVMVS